MTDTLGDRLAMLRAQKDMTQRDLAEKTEVSWSQISRYESGHAIPRLRTLLKLAEALDVSVDELNGGAHSSDSGREITIMLTPEEEKKIEELATSEGLSFNDAVNKVMGMGLKMKMDRSPDLMAQLEADMPGAYEKLLKLLAKE